LSKSSITNANDDGGVMPPFQAFQQGSESRLPPPPDSRPGRFRVFPSSSSSGAAGANSAPYPHSSFSNFSHPARTHHYQHTRQHSHSGFLGGNGGGGGGSNGGGRPMTTTTGYGAI